MAVRPPFFRSLPRVLVPATTICKHTSRGEGRCLNLGIHTMLLKPARVPKNDAAGASWDAPLRACHDSEASDMLACRRSSWEWPPMVQHMTSTSPLACPEWSLDRRWARTHTQSDMAAIGQVIYRQWASEIPSTKFSKMKWHVPCQAAHQIEMATPSLLICTCHFHTTIHYMRQY